MGMGCLFMDDETYITPQQAQQEKLNSIAAKLIELGLPWKPGMLTSDGERIHLVEDDGIDGEVAYFTYGEAEFTEFGDNFTSDLHPPDLSDDVTYAYVEMWIRDQGLTSMQGTSHTRLALAQQQLRLAKALTLD